MLHVFNLSQIVPHSALAGTRNGDSFHAVIQEAKFRGLNVFDGLSARCSPAHLLECAPVHAQPAAVSVSLSVAQPLSSCSLIPAAAEGVALLLQKGTRVAYNRRSEVTSLSHAAFVSPSAPGRTVVSVAASRPLAPNSPETVHWHLTLDDSSVAGSHCPLYCFIYCQRHFILSVTH